MSDHANLDLAGKEDPAPKPLFVIGSSRSGTTLLQRILNSFDEVCIWGEHGGFLKYIARGYYTFQNEIVVRHLDSLKIPTKKDPSTFEKLKNPKIWSAWSNQFNGEDLKESCRNFIDSLLFVNKPGLKFYGFKEIRYGRRGKGELFRPLGNPSKDGVLDFLKKIFPESKFIFIIRNPLDSIASTVSCVKECDISEAVDIAVSWAEQNEHLLEFYLKKKKDCFFLKYEDLIDKNKTSLADLSSFLGLPLSSKQYSVLDLESGRGADPDKKNRKNLFTDRVIYRIIKKVKKTAEKFGYYPNKDYFHGHA